MREITNAQKDDLKGHVTQPPLLVRLATIQDVPEMNTIRDAVFDVGNPEQGFMYKDYGYDFTQGPNQYTNYYVAANNKGEVLGMIRVAKVVPTYLLGYITDDYTYYGGLFVNPTAFRQGVARQLLTYLMLKHTKLACLVYQTPVKNEASIKLHDSLGFKNIGKVTLKGKELSVHILN